MGQDPLILRSVEKAYGGLRPLRVRELCIPEGRITMLIGFDRPAAEVFVNLITGAALPDSGEVISLGRPTHRIVDSDEWLSFVERFGIASDRIVLLEAMTVTQNLAIAYDLELEPVPPNIAQRVALLAAEVGIDAALLETRIGDAPPLLRSRVHLARALALDPTILVLEHPTASLSGDDVNSYAQTIRVAAGKRRLTTVGLLMDVRFAKETGGRLLYWQPATGDVRKRSPLKFWNYF
jgi:ABC-type transporter Mla maintaining outer membrane lipid asymmetry ATPase subunit MlaF